MIAISSTNRVFRRGLAVAGLTAGAIALFASAASAGECPADKTGSDLMKAGATAPVGVTDEVLTHIDLSKEAIRLNDREFRLRRLEIQPGGVVPWHSHGDRPALIYIVQGSVTEYSSNCAVPIVHKAGDSAMESVGLSHWWKNTGEGVAVLISADIFHTMKEDKHMM